MQFELYDYGDTKKADPKMLDYLGFCLRNLVPECLEAIKAYSMIEDSGNKIFAFGGTMLMSLFVSAFDNLCNIVELEREDRERLLGQILDECKKGYLEGNPRKSN